MYFSAQYNATECTLHLTLGCTLSSVSFPPIEPQTPQCHHNVEQSLVSQVVSSIWWSNTRILYQNKLYNNIIFDTCFVWNPYTLAPAMLPNCSWRMESTFHTVEEKAWGFSSRMEQPLWEMKTQWWVANLQWDHCAHDTTRALSTEQILARSTKNIKLLNNVGLLILKWRRKCDARRERREENFQSTRTMRLLYCCDHGLEIHGISQLSAPMNPIYLIEVPHSEWQSSPCRIVRFPLSISVARDIQIHSVLNILLKIKSTNSR